MKRTLAVLLILAVCLISAFAGGSGEAAPAKPRVVATIFPEYDWARVILGDNPAGMELTLLLDKATDLHNFQPTSLDILTVSTCDLFIYCGGESDGWVDDVLKHASNKDMKVICLMDVLGDAAREETVPEGAQHDHDHDHDDGEKEYDEHVWLSLKNAELFCRAICDALCEIDPADKAVYRANLATYTAALENLDSRYSALVASAKRKTLLFGDRFPFRYLAEDYGLECYAAFSGCSAETEASFETIAFLVEKADSLDLDYIMVIEGGGTKIADTIIANSARKDRKVLVMDSIQSVTAEDLAKGASYLGKMESNLEVLGIALN